VIGNDGFPEGVVMDNEQLLPPQWGTFSVIDHQDPAALIPEILLYDRLVFPVPTDRADRQRLADHGWKPDLLDTRLEELKGLVHATPWTPELREKWSTRWERLKQLGQDTEVVAMGLTPMVLALSAFEDQFPPPIMIAASQDPTLAKVDLALTDQSRPQKDAREALDWEVRALFERRLDMPIVMHPYRTYEKAIALAHDSKYQQARRSLFEWEDQVVSKQWPTEAAVKRLEELVDAHDDFMKSNFVKTVKCSIFRVMEVSISTAVTHATGQPLAGLAAGGAVKLVGARLPGLTAKPTDPLAEPGATLHKAISVMFHGA
jgi:hypothetical protein